MTDSKRLITHCFSSPIDMTAGFSAIIEVGRHERTGQFEVFVNLGVPGNSPSMNEINVADINDVDIRQIMKIAMTKMQEDRCTCIIFELTVDPTNGANMIEFI